MLFDSDLCLFTIADIVLGESHSALILLYRAIDLPTAEEIQQ